MGLPGFVARNSNRLADPKHLYIGRVTIEICHISRTLGLELSARLEAASETNRPTSFRGTTAAATSQLDHASFISTQITRLTQSRDVLSFPSSLATTYQGEP